MLRWIEQDESTGVWRVLEEGVCILETEHYSVALYYQANGQAGRWISGEEEL